MVNTKFVPLRESIPAKYRFFMFSKLVTGVSEKHAKAFVPNGASQEKMVNTKDVPLG
jgi:hypothetical protein